MATMKCVDYNEKGDKLFKEITENCLKLNNNNVIIYLID